MCKSILKTATKDVYRNDQSLLTAMFAGVNVYFNYTGDAKCLELADPDQIGSSMWDFQACTEMVMPMCFDGDIDMFEKADWNETAYEAECKKRWNVSARPDMAPLMFGEKHLRGASNIVFRSVVRIHLIYF